LSSHASFAQAKKIEMSPPSVKQLQLRRVDRQTALLVAKFKGYIGETDQGLIAVRDMKRLAKNEQEKITQLVTAENQDRLTWYKEVISFNKLNEQEKGFLIKSAFDTFKGTDAKGTYYYENKKWQKKY